MSMTMEKRNAYFKSDFKTRSEDNGDKYIEGYFAVFGQETEIWDGWFEQLSQGAFTKSIADNDIRCLFNHEDGFVLGRTSAGTLELSEDVHGLWGRVKINPHDRSAMDVYARVERGDISGCSFGFFPTNEQFEDRADGTVLNTILDTDTIEVSVCTFPAYPQTEIQARKQDFNNRKKQSLEQTRAQLRKRLEVL